MRVELLYFDGCPSWTVAAERLTEALGRLGREDVVVERRQVTTPEQAAELGFVGSPSIRVNGMDPFASGEETVGLACRLYATSSGPSGSPETAQLVAALS